VPASSPATSASIPTRSCTRDTSRPRRANPDLHLYKHYVSRGYLNVDEAHRLFVFMWGSGDDDLDRPFCEVDVYYKKLRGLAQGLEFLDVHFLDPDDQWRSRPVSPPAEPVDVVGNVVPLRRRDPGRTRRRRPPA